MINRAALLIFCYLIFHISSYAQEQQILVTADFMGKTLYNIIDEIGQKHGLTFDYKKEDIPDKFMPGQFFNGTPLEEVLDKLLKPFDVHYIIQKNGQVIIRKKGEELIKVYNPTKANFTLKGRLLDNASGESLPFATVYFKSNMKGTVSNVDGFFTLLNAPSDTSTIVIQYIGYKTKEVQLNPEMVEAGDLTIKVASMATQLEEVVITDQKEHMVKASGKISSYSIAPAQLSSLPSLGEKDIFRGLQMLPGISATNETSSGLYVRGGTPDQNLILFDGFTVYHVDHFYGFFSAFNSNAVKDVQFYKGGFEAKYGGRLSSVVLLTGKNGNNNKVSGNFGASVISVNGSLEVPIANGKGSLFLSGRRSFTDVIRSGLYNDIFDLFQEEEDAGQQGFGQRGGFSQIENEPDFFFYDLNAKLTLRPTNKDVFSISIYNGQDKLDNSNDFNSSQFGGFGGFGGGDDAPTFDNNTVDLNDWGNVGSSLKWSRQWDERLFSNSVLSYSKYFTDRERYSETELVRQDSTFTILNGTLEDNSVNDITFRSDTEYLLSSQHTIGFGTQITYNHVDYNQIQNDTTTVLDRNDKGLVSAIYAQDAWTPNDRLTVTPGIRISQYDVTSKVYVEPRLSASYKLNDKLKAKAAWGLYNQFVTRVVREDISQGSRDFWLLANEDLNPVSSSTHYVAGLTYETEGFLFDVEGYHKDMTGLSEYTLRFSNDFRNRSTEVSELFYEGTGFSRGLEFLVQKKFGKYTGWIGYTLSETIHEFPELSDNPYPALHDQTHEFKIVNSLRAGPWTFSGTWVYATGKPYTSPIGGYEVTLLDGTTNSYVSVGEKNGFRLADYHRMDLSATYSFDWGSKAKAELGLSAFNIYDNTNIWYKTFEIIEEEMVVTDVNTIGFTPNMFFNIKF